MNTSKIKNLAFKTTIWLIGNGGLSRSFLGRIVKEYAVQNCRINEITINGYRMILDKDDVMQISLFPYEPMETELIKKHMHDRDITVNVGANIGYYTLLMAKLKAVVHSFEPEPNNFALLKKCRA